MTPTAQIAAIRQRAEHAKEIGATSIAWSQDIPFLLAAWDTHQSALRALVAQFREKEAATHAGMKLLRLAAMDREAGELRASVQAYADCADALERLLESEP